MTAGDMTGHEALRTAREALAAGDRVRAKFYALAAAHRFGVFHGDLVSADAARRMTADEVLSLIEHDSRISRIRRDMPGFSR
jgi:hypothetical protein